MSSYEFLCFMNRSSDCSHWCGLELPFCSRKQAMPEDLKEGHKGRCHQWVAVSLVCLRQSFVFT